MRTSWRPPVKPPVGAAEIDWGHPLGRGLVGCWVMNEGGGGPINLVNRMGSTPSGGPTWGPSPTGLQLNFAAASSQYVDAGQTLPAMSSPGSIVLRLRPTTVASTFYMPVGRVAGGGNDWEIQLEQTTAKIGYSFNGGDYIKSATGLAANTVYDVGITIGGPGVGMFLYLNGVLDNTSLGDGRTWRTADGAVEFGRRPGGGFYYDGGLHHVYIYDKVGLTAEANWWLATEPYAFLRPIVRRYYSIPSGAAFTLPWVGPLYEMATHNDGELVWSWSKDR